MDELSQILESVSVTVRAESQHNNNGFVGIDNNSESNVSNQSIEAPDMDQSFDIKPDIDSVVPPMIYPDVQPTVIEQKKKIEVREVKHRNTGKIGIANIQRRRALSMSANSSAEYFRNMKQNRTSGRQNRLVRHESRAPIQMASTVVRLTPTIHIRPNRIEINNQAASAAGVAASDSHDMAANSQNAVQAEVSLKQEQQSDHEEQEEQQQQQQQQLQELVRLINSGTFCVICQRQYVTRQSLRNHLKTQKHQQNLQNMVPARHRLLLLAHSQANRQ